MARAKSRKKRTIRRKNRFFLPYPVIFFVLLCAGVILTLWTFRAAADIVVSAKVSAQPVTGPAVINSPTYGEHFSSVPITISGDCPTDGSGGYVKIYDNSVFRGAAICDSNNQFSLSSDLFPGANTLNAQIYNITDDPGPAGNSITVYYDQPQPPTPAQPTQGNQPSSSSGSGATAAPQFTIGSDFKYSGYYINQTVQWNLDIEGGKTPYAVDVDWGDGSSTVISRSTTGVFTIEHKYSKTGSGQNNSYIIRINASDAVGNQASLQLFVIINRPMGGAVGVTGQTPGGTSFFSRYKSQILKFIWPSYLIILLMLVSFWLGEREEVLILAHMGVAKKRRR